MKIRWPGLAAFVLVTCVVMGCKKTPADPFPPSGAVNGWVKTAETQAYPADKLWQYLDGGAEEYVNAGVVSCSTSDYKFQDKLEAVVDVFTMKDAKGPKSLMAGEPPSGAPGSVGDESRVYSQSLVFRNGKSLVRITAYQTAQGEDQAMLSLARAIDKRL